MNFTERLFFQKLTSFFSPTKGVKRSVCWMRLQLSKSICKKYFFYALGRQRFWKSNKTSWDLHDFYYNSKFLRFSRWKSLRISSYGKNPADPRFCNIPVNTLTFSNDKNFFRIHKRTALLSKYATGNSYYTALQKHVSTLLHTYILYLKNFWQPIAYVQKNIFEKNSHRSWYSSSHLYTSFVNFCVQIDQLFEAQWVFEKCLNMVKWLFLKENAVDFEFFRKFEISLSRIIDQFWRKRCP